MKKMSYLKKYIFLCTHGKYYSLMMKRMLALRSLGLNGDGCLRKVFGSWFWVQKRRDVGCNSEPCNLADLVPDIKSPHIFTATSPPATTPVLSWVVIACLMDIIRSSYGVVGMCIWAEWWLFANENAKANVLIPTERIQTNTTYRRK